MRYSRQTSIRDVGPQGQEKLTRARVLVVGVGGLGSPVAMYLASAGVGTLGLIDSDQVDLSNLQRQIIFENEDQGRNKAEVAAERLSLLNPEVQVSFWREALTSRNVIGIISGFDLVIDCTDSFAAKFLINDAAYLVGVPWVYAAVNQFDGQVAWFSSKSEDPCYRCLLPHSPKASIRSCSETGVLGPWVGVVGSLQAHLAVCGIISGFDPAHPLFQRSAELMLLDGKGRVSVETRKIPKNSSCSVCSKVQKDVVLVSEESDTVCDRVAKGLEVDPMELPSQNAMYVDVRSPEEFAKMRISGALNLPLEGLLASPTIELKNVETVFVYCTSGIRSMEAVLSLRERGIDARSVRGGLSGVLKDFPSVLNIENGEE
jgi:molybdopterin/thiamine biosynthesis adenylyltransferase/rhodanese-related sulfurtransferase